MKLIRNIIGAVAGLSVATAILLTPASAAAATAVFSVSPTGGTYTTGTTFAMTISEDSGSNDVDSAKAELNYNSSALEVVSLNTSMNPFGGFCATPPSYGGGRISTGECTTLGSKKQGKQTLAIATFKVLATSGSSSVAFANSSQLVANGVDLSWTQNGATYNFVAPAPSSNNNGGTPAPTASAPTKKTPSTAGTAANSGEVAAAETQVETTAAPADETKKDEKDTKKSDAKNTDDKKTSSSAWFWPMAIIAIAAGYIAARAIQKRNAAASAENNPAKSEKSAPAKKAARKK